MLRKWIVYQKEKLEEQAVDHYYRVFLKDRKEHTSTKIFNMWKKELDKVVGENISKISCHTLVLWAEKDFLLPLSWAEGIKAQLKNSTLKTLSKCGHFSQEEEPILIAKAIKEFLVASG